MTRKIQVTEEALEKLCEKVKDFVSEQGSPLSFDDYGEYILAVRDDMQSLVEAHEADKKANGDLGRD